ncbi:putative adhesin [Lentzea sp. NPDC051208]|uniref:putative adhesin n=1 Tax=Lentzea sp. NPDC051208 TaxID=3154642 RepID=UPI0034139E90
MGKLYVIGHGGTAGGGSTFVPAGTTVHSYAKPGETLSAGTVRLILSSGGSETGVVVARAGRSLLNWEVSPLDTDDLQGDLTALAKGLDGTAHFVQSNTMLCTTPTRCLLRLKKWEDDRRRPLSHHKSCEGLFKLYPEHDEIHLLICQSYTGLDTMRLETGMPRFARDADKAIKRDRRGEPVVALDSSAHDELDTKAAEILRLGRKDPLAALSYLHNELPQTVLAQLMAVNSQLEDWVTETWADFQKTAPSHYQHDQNSAMSRVEQYHQAVGEHVRGGWLTERNHRDIRGKQPPASIEDAMEAVLWAEVFTQWFYSAYLPAADGARDDETLYHLLHLCDRWNSSHVFATELVDFCRERSLGHVEAARLVADLDAAIGRAQAASTNARSVPDDESVDGAPSVRDEAVQLYVVATNRMEEIYQQFLIAVSTALTP